MLYAAALCGFGVALTSALKSEKAPAEGYSELNYNAYGIKFDGFKIIDLSDEVLLSEINRVIVSDGLIFISDSENYLYSFNMDGSFHARYGNKGRAGNEYLYISSFDVEVDSDQVCIIDDTQGKFLYFNYDGSLIRTSQLDVFNQNVRIYDFYSMSDDKWFVHNRIFNDDRILFSFVNPDSGAVQPFRTVRFSTDNIADMCGEHMLNVYDGKVCYIAPYEPYIYSLEGDKEVKRYEFKGITKTVSPKEQSKIDDYSIFKNFELYNEGAYVGFSGLYETDSFIFLNEMTDLNYYIIDKKTGVQRRYSYSYDEDVSNLPIFGIRGTYEDWLVGVVKPSKLLNYEEYVPRRSSDENVRTLRGAVNKARIDSNPSIFLYRIASI